MGLALFFTLVLTGVGGRASAQQDPRSVAESVFERGGYSGDLDHTRREGGGADRFPGGLNFDDREGSGDGRSLFESRRTAERAEVRPTPAPRIPEFGQGAATFGWILTVLVVLLLVGGLIYVALKASHSPDAPELPPIGPSEPIAPSAGLASIRDPGDPDVLAKEGRFEEAIVALLLRSMRKVGWSPSSGRSRTAREVLFSVEGPSHAPLQVVVGSAERVRFAGEEATESLFAETRNAARSLGV